MRWRLEEIAREEMRKGRKIWVGYGVIRIDEKWWRWDEKEEVPMDGRGRTREKELGEEKREKGERDDGEGFRSGGGKRGREGKREEE